jgi:hypothetical protein
MKTYCIRRTINVIRGRDIEKLMRAIREDMAQELSYHLTRTDDFFVVKESLFSGEVILYLTVHVATDAN